MKKFAVMAMGLLIASGAMADVVGSVHDLTTGGAGTDETSDTDRVCVFCHTPHGADSSQGALWNRQAPGTSFTMYNATFSPTMDMTVAATPQGVSLACLSCHDGTVAFDVLINGPTTTTGVYNYAAAGASQAWTNWTGNGSLSGEGAPAEFAGGDLTSEHPISVTYDPVQDPDFNIPGDVITAGLPLYGASTNQVECGTCHDPHDTSIVPFLRISNAASALCTTCHIK